MVTNMTRVVDPVLMLSKIHERLRPQGTLVVCSAYDWDAQRTPVEKWIGGRKVGMQDMFRTNQCSNGAASMRKPVVIYC